jgi:hypothetical protein
MMGREARHCCARSTTLIAEGTSTGSLAARDPFTEGIAAAAELRRELH